MQLGSLKPDMKSLLEGCKKGRLGSKQWNLELVVYEAPRSHCLKWSEPKQQKVLGNLSVYKCSMSPRKTETNGLCFYTVQLLPWWLFRVVTAAYGIFQTWNDLSSLISFRCKTHKDYPFNAEYWRWFPAFLQTSQICFCCCLWVVYVAFSLRQTPFFSFSPTKMQYMYSVTLCCFLFWKKEMLKWFWRAHCVD